MSMRWIIGAALGLGVSMWLGVPSGWAADGTTAEAAPAVDATTVEHLRSAIEAEGDPQLKQAMEEQLELLESGDLNLQDLDTDRIALGAPAGTGELAGGGLSRAGGTPLPMPVVDIGGGQLGPPTVDWTESLPPEARKELGELFKQGTGDPNSAKDQELREQAGEILEKYGIDPREMESGGEGREGKGEYGRESSHEFGSAGLERGEGFERALEQMSPEAREQMERHFGQEREMPGQGQGTERETTVREYDSPMREHETMTREYEATTREYEAPAREYEAQTREYEAPSQEHEVATHEVEAPTHEAEMPTREYEAPTMETPTREYEAQGPGDGSGMGPH